MSLLLVFVGKQITTYHFLQYFLQFTVSLIIILTHLLQ